MNPAPWGPPEGLGIYSSGTGRAVLVAGYLKMPSREFDRRFHASSRWIRNAINHNRVDLVPPMPGVEL